MLSSRMPFAKNCIGGHSYGLITQKGKGGIRSQEAEDRREPKSSKRQNGGNINYVLQVSRNIIALDVLAMKIQFEFVVRSTINLTEGSWPDISFEREGTHIKIIKPVSKNPPPPYISMEHVDQGLRGG